MSTATRKPVQTERYVKLVAISDNCVGEIEISVHKGRRSDITHYTFQRIADGFILWKQGSGENEVYSVRMDSPQGQRCDCPGHRHHGHCKHEAAVRALRARGSL